MADAPKLLDRLSPDDLEHFEAVKAMLDDADLPYVVDPSLVRGLDYYTRTVFEFESDRLGAAWAAAAATTASSSRSAVRRHPAWASPRASSGC